MKRKLISFVTSAVMLLSALPAVPAVTAAAEDITILNADFDDGGLNGFEVYAPSEGTNPSIANEDGAVKFTEGSGWNKNNGVKRDITQELAAAGFKSGDTISVSLDFSCSWYNNPANVFIEVNGVKTTIVSDGVGGETWTKTSLSGSAAVTYNAGDTVYFCVTQHTGTHLYDNILITYSGGDSATDAPSTTEIAPSGSEILNDTFDDGTLCGYEIYDPTAGTNPAINTDDGCLRFTEDSGWNKNNGIKKDITALLAVAGFKSGDTVSVSLDFSCSWYNNPANVFIEVNGVRTILVSEGPGGEAWLKANLTGSAAVTYNAGDTVYFCVTQHTGNHLYDNIALTYSGSSAAQTPAATATADVTAAPTSAPTPAPVPTQTPTPRPSLNPNPDGGELFSYSGNDFTDADILGRFSQYDRADSGVTIEADGAKLTFSTMTSSTNKNGFRMDITDFVKSTGSGHLYSAELDLRSTWWSDNQGTLAIEVITNGSASETVLDKKAGTDTKERYIYSGSGYVFFDDASQINLVYYQLAGMHEYYSVSLSCDTEKTATPPPTAVPTETPTPKPTADPNAFIHDEFNDSSVLAKYDGYSSSNTDDAVSVSNGKLKYTAGNDYNAANGIRRDVTDEIKSYVSGTNFVVSLDINAWWGSSGKYEHPASVFFEVVSENGAASQTAVASGPSESDPYTGDDAYIFGSALLSFRDTDRIYLCVTQDSGTHYYDNITISASSPYEDGIVQLTSGRSFPGTYMPENARTIYIDTFSDAGELEKYTPYSTAFSGDAKLDSGMAAFSFASDWSSDNGVSVNVTDAMRAGYPGGDFRAALDFRTTYWGGSAVNVSLRYGNDTKGWRSYDAASAVGTDSSKITHISGVIAGEDLAGYDPETDEMIINITQGAGNWLIDNVAIEIPYTSARVFDTAVSDWSQLDKVNTVSVMYGGVYVSESAVVWDTTAENDNVVYGTAGSGGLRAKAIRTTGAKKLTVTADGIKVEDTALEYGQRAAASGSDEMVFLVDNLTDMNLLSAVSATGSYSEPVSGTTEVERAIKVSDVGSGVRAEGTIPEYAGNEECIVAFDSSGSPVTAQRILIDADGKYCAELNNIANGSYTAVMTDTGASAAFAYADASAFAELVARVKNGESVSALIGGADREINRITIGAEYFDVYDKLTAAAQSAVCGEFKNVLLKSGETRAQAAAAFDLLTAANSAAAELASDEWKQLVTDNAKELGISVLDAYTLFAAMSDKAVSEVKAKLAKKNITVSGYSYDFAACVINTAVTEATHYSEVLDILKANAGLLGISASSLTSDAAKYVQSNIKGSMLTIAELKGLAEKGIASSAANTSSGGGSSSGGGGGGGGSSSGSSSSSGGGTVAVGISGNNVVSAGNRSELDTSPIQPSAPAFSDLSEAPWAVEAIEALVSIGVLNGYEDNTFRPQNKVTREEFVKIIVTALGLGESGNVSFTDIDPSRWSYDAVAKGVQAGIINGMPDGSFAPETQITRQDAAVMIYRALQAIGAEASGGGIAFDDAAAVSDYASEAVGALTAKGIITGKDNNMFAPLDSTSRAEAAVIIYRALNTR
ncbi:MAG: S-layer homology domain-containing protein [Candidatus Ornithomonoglobus sp.]